METWDTPHSVLSSFESYGIMFGTEQLWNGTVLILQVTVAVWPHK